MAVLYANINGRIVVENEKGIELNNRAYLYGDGLFETIRVFEGKIINFENHYARLKEGAKMIKLNMPEHHTETYFFERIEELLFKSEIKGGARVRLSLDRKASGSYSPESNDTEYTIDVKPLPIKDFELNSKGIELDIYTAIRKSKNILSNYKTKNGLIYVLAAIEAKEKGLSDMLITNVDHEIIESSNSNLFIVSNGVLYTPGLDVGCLAGTMRMQVINVAIANGLKVYESPILPQNLLGADEVFLTNAIHGIVWVGGYRTKRYFNNMSRKIVALLNSYWDNKLSPEQGAITEELD